MLAQAFAFNVFGGDKVMPILFANLMNSQNVRVIEAGGGISLALETAEPILVLVLGRPSLRPGKRVSGLGPVPRRPENCYGCGLLPVEEINTA